MCQEMCLMSSKPACTGKGTTSPMGLANCSLGTCPYRLCGSDDGENVICCSGRAFQVAEVHVMGSTTSSKTISVLRDVFARFGLPRQIVSDNGPQFTSSEFNEFLTSNGVKHITTSPYHPSSNGAAERFVQTIKQAIRAEHQKGVSLERILASFLLQYI